MARSGRGDSDDLVGFGAYRRHRNSRHPGVMAGTGTPTGPYHRAAVCYGADGVDIDEIDVAAISVRTPVSAGPVASLPDLADTVRRKLIAPIGDHTQSHVDAVDIDIDDLDVPPVADCVPVNRRSRSSSGGRLLSGQTAAGLSATVYPGASRRDEVGALVEHDRTGWGGGDVGGCARS